MQTDSHIDITAGAQASWRDDPAAWLAALPPDARTAIRSAAILGTFDVALLAHVADTRWVVSWIDEGMVVPVAPLYQVEAALCDAILDDLMEPSSRFVAASKAALERLVAAWQTNEIAETALVDAQERICELAIQRSPADLAVVVDAMLAERFITPAHRALVRYYYGLGEGLLERFEPAQATFAALLASDDVPDALRARVLNSSATFARLRGDYEYARAGFRESDAIWERLGNVARQGLARMNQGILGYYLQDYAAASRDLDESLAMFEGAGALQWQAMAHSNLGLVARDQGRWYDALAAFERARTLFRENSPLDYQGYVSNNIGEVELLRGNYDTARGWFEQALTEWSTRSFAVDAYLNLGLASEAQGDYAAALPHYQRSLELALELGRFEIVASLHYRIGRTAQQQGDAEAAHVHYDQAIAVIEDSRAPMRDEGLMISLMGRWQQVYEAACALAIERGLVADAFAYAERARARAFSDVLMRHGTGVADANLPPVSTAEVQAVLPAGTLLLSYVGMGLRGPEADLLKAMPLQAARLRDCLTIPARMFVFALTRSSLDVYACGIDPNVFQPSSALRADGARFLNPKLLRRAHTALIGPVAPLLDHASAVVVAPHGPLHQFPFSALPDEAGRALVDGVPWTTTPSATILLHALQATPEPTRELSPCLALGYDGEGYGLRHTGPEADRIAARCHGVAWHGAPGVRDRLREAAGGYRWLHLACHGEFDHADPLRSWLEIGPGEVLRADDVIASFQLHADLVTLSACRSGLSRVLRGDEPMGLVRAFLYAGARAVLVTLWQVEDRSARLLMERFYAELTAPHRPDPATALQTAQQYLGALTGDELRAAMVAWGEDADDTGMNDSPFADPIYWAAYVVVGAPVSSSI